LVFPPGVSPPRLGTGRSRFFSPALRSLNSLFCIAPFFFFFFFGPVAPFPGCRLPCRARGRTFPFFELSFFFSLRSHFLFSHDQYRLSGPKADSNLFLSFSFWAGRQIDFFFPDDTQDMSSVTELTLFFLFFFPLGSLLAFFAGWVST